MHKFIPVSEDEFKERVEGDYNSTIDHPLLEKSDDTKPVRYKYYYSWSGYLVGIKRICEYNEERNEYFAYDKAGF